MGIIQKISSQIRPYMKEKGYTYSKKCYYSVLNNIAFCVQFDAPGGLVYATFFIMPLYIPSQHRYYTYGNRINTLPSSKLPLLSKSAPDEEITKWCTSLCAELDTRVFPFFQKITTTKQLVSTLESNPYFSCPAVFVARLKLFTYLYTENLEKLSNVIQEFPKILKESTFLAKSVCDRYYEEVTQVESLLRTTVQERHSICNDMIEETLKMCFT